MKAERYVGRRVEDGIAVLDRIRQLVADGQPVTVRIGRGNPLAFVEHLRETGATVIDDPSITGTEWEVTFPRT